MAILIKRDKEKREEVINILERLGGKNIARFFGDNIDSYYYLLNNGEIWMDSNINIIPKPHLIFTVDEFNTKYPFNIGDKVLVNNKEAIIEKISVGYDGKAWYRTNIGTYLQSDLSKITNKETMENTRIVALTLEQAKNFYNKGGELKDLALTVYTEEELNPLPKSWEEYCKMYKVPAMIFGPCIPNKYVALWKIEQLRNCYRQGWEPDWRSGNPIASIYFIDNKIWFLS